MPARISCTLMLIAAFVPLVFISSPVLGGPAEFSHRHIPGGGVFLALPLRHSASADAEQIGHLQVNCGQTPLVARIVLNPQQMDRLPPSHAASFVIPDFDEAMRLCGTSVIQMEMLARGYLPLPYAPYVIINE